MIGILQGKFWAALKKNIQAVKKICLYAVENQVESVESFLFQSVENSVESVENPFK